MNRVKIKKIFRKIISLQVRIKSVQIFHKNNFVLAIIFKDNLLIKKGFQEKISQNFYFSKYNFTQFQNLIIYLMIINNNNNKCYNSCIGIAYLIHIPLSSLESNHLNT